MGALRVGLVAVLLLVGCGRGPASLGGGSEGAAQALGQASSALSRPVANLGFDLANLGLAIDVEGRGGGTARVTYKMLASVEAGATEMAVTYKRYSDDGLSFYDGVLAMKTSAEVGEAMVGAQLGVKGKLTLSGELEDFLEVDVAEAVTVAEDAVALSLDGFISTRTGSYTYGGQPLTFAVGAALPVDR